MSRGKKLVIMYAVLATIAVTLHLLNGCITSPQGLSAHSQCVQRCNEERKACMESGASADSCAKASRDCKRNCYNEGSGQGGR
jgi:hypothetical protein